MDLNSKYSDSSSKKTDVSIFLSKKNISLLHNISTHLSKVLAVIVIVYFSSTYVSALPFFTQSDVQSFLLNNVFIKRTHLLFCTAICFQDDCETESLKSEISELCLLKQKLNSQISQLQMKVETYERDIECFEMVSSLFSLGIKHLKG